MPVAATTNCNGLVLDPNVLADIRFASKPKWIAESSVQAPASAISNNFVTYLNRVKNMIEQYNFVGWTYIDSNWPAHGWPSSTWGNSRIEADAPIKSWFEANIVRSRRYVFG